MPASFKNKQSKRLTCHKKYKIQKKVRAHNRKQRKEAKKNPKKSGRKQDPGVPNSAPFKEEVLKIAEDQKQKKQEERDRMKDHRKKQRAKLVDQRRSLTSMVTDAQKRSAEFDRKQVDGGDDESAPTRDVETSRKAYYKEFRKVIDAADVVLQVLDARDPIGSRCPEVEEAILNSGSNKRLVLVLNKIDLVPKEIIEKWLKHLRNEFPAVAFKASTQSQRENLAHSKVPISLVMNDDLYTSSRCLGADMLMKLLNNYCRNKDIKTSITVGVVGFPNTGKSSLINSLKRSKACIVGAAPGVTKQMQEINLDKHIRLLDSPGIVLARGDSDSAVILRNCVKIETISDPIEPVSAILKRCNKEKLMLHYRIPDYSDVQEFLFVMAKRLGQLKKGGIPDVNKAARSVLKDWTSGKITYYTHPPEQHTLPSHVSAEIVTQMKKEFSVDELSKDEADDLGQLKAVSSNHIVIESEGPTEGVVEPGEEEMAQWDADENVEQESMDEGVGDELKNVVVEVKTKKKKKSASSEKKQKKAADPSDEMNRQTNRLKKSEVKKMKKKRKKADALSEDLSDVLTGAMSLDSPAYSFQTDYK